MPRPITASHLSIKPMSDLSQPQGAPSNLARVTDPLVATIAAAVLTAALHAIVIAVPRDLFGHFTWSWSDPDVTWMLALGYLLIMVPVGVVFSIVGVFRKTGAPVWILAFALAALGAFSILLLFSRVESWAWMLVATGLGVRSAAWAARHVSTFRRGARLISMVGGSAYVVLAGWSTLGRPALERRALASAASGEGFPNVLLIILDTVAAADLGLYGNAHAPTPTLDSLAAQSVVFDHAFSAAPWTLPSHASLFTGLLPSQHGADWESPLSQDPPTLAEAFRDNGYATGGFTANLIATGFQSGLARGFTTYRASKTSAAEVALHSTLAQSLAVRSALRTYRESHWLGGALRQLMSLDFRPDESYQSHQAKTATDVSDNFLAWNRELDGRRFFAFLNYFDAHRPYDSPMRNRFNEGRTVRDRHEGALLYIDGEIARVLGALRQRGELDRTIVVVTADHGEQFGEHGLTGHGNSLYSALLHVPLLIRFPDGRGAGTRIPATVSTRDLPRTIAWAAGVGVAPAFGGASLHPFVDGSESTGRVAIAELSRARGQQDRKDQNYAGGMRAVIDDSLYVIARYADNSVEAFRFRDDPMERIPVVEAGGRLQGLRKLLITATQKLAAGPEPHR